MLFATCLAWVLANAIDVLGDSLQIDEARENKLRQEQSKKCDLALSPGGTKIDNCRKTFSKEETGINISKIRDPYLNLAEHDHKFVHRCYGHSPLWRERPDDRCTCS